MDNELIEEFFDIEAIIKQLIFSDINFIETGRSIELRIYAETEEVICAVEKTLGLDINIAEQVKDMFHGFYIVAFLENESFFYQVVRHFAERYYHPYYDESGDGQSDSVMTLMGLPEAGDYKS